MSEQKKEFKQPELSEYPFNSTDEKLVIIDAFTIYKFLDQKTNSGRWQAVVTVESHFNPTPEKSVRIYRWQWKTGRNGQYGWQFEQKTNINKKSVWEKLKPAIDAQVAKYLQV